MQLSWAAPYDGNSPIKKFLIEYKRAKGNWEKDIDRYVKNHLAITFCYKCETKYLKFRRYFLGYLYLEMRLKPACLAYDQPQPTTSGLSQKTNSVPLSRRRLSPLLPLKKPLPVHLKIARSMLLTSIPSESHGNLPHLRTGTANFRGKINIHTTLLDEIWSHTNRTSDNHNVIIFRYYVGYKLASSNKSFVFETVDISKESGKEHHLDILNLK